MPANISLSSYTLRVLEKSTKEYIKMDEINENEDLLDCFADFLSYFLEHPSDEDEIEKLFMIADYSQQRDITIGSISYRVISGIVKTGSYGYESEIYDKNENVVAYQRKREDAELLPFYFLAGIPTNKDEGIVLLQGFRQFGIKSVFEGTFGKHFSTDRPEYKIVLGNLVPENMLNNLLAFGDATNLRYIRYEQPVDIADAVDTEDHVERNVQAEVILSGNNDFLSNIVRSVQDRLPYRKEGYDDILKNLVEVTAPDFEYDEVKVKLRINGKYRTINLCNFDNLRPTIDISDQVQTLASGHPEFNSINQLAIDIFKDLAESLGVERN